jgi:hypothetical protein
MKGRFLETFRSRKFQYGGYATLIVAIVVAAAVGVNLLVDQVPLRVDLTQNRVYSLSEESLGVLDRLAADVTVTHLLKTASEDPQVQEVLRRYGSRTRRLTVQAIDPDLNPTWSRQYDPAGTGLREGTIVVASGKRFKTITRADMYTVSTRSADGPPAITALTLEQRLTSAVRYVTAERNPSLYVLTGHGEETFASLGIQRRLENANYDVRDFSLLALQGVPAEADVVAVVNPTSDLSGPDLEKLLAWLGQGGRMLVACDPRPLPNLAELLKAYGVACRTSIVVEGSTGLHTGNPLFLLPAIELHDITRPLRANDIPVLFPFAQPVEQAELRRRALRLEPLLVSSRDSWARTSLTSLSNLDRGPGDAAGPFALAQAIVDPASGERPRETKLVVLGSYRFLTQPFFNLTPGNADFLSYCVNWLSGSAEEVTIAAKELASYPLVMNGLTRLLYVILVVIVMPLAVLAGGFAVWLGRRRL